MNISMFLFVFGIIASPMFVRADAQCPQLAGQYECKDDGHIFTFEIKQETVNSVENYQVPLLDGTEVVFADGVRHGDEKASTLAKCEKNKLFIEELKNESSEETNIISLGNYRFSRQDDGRLKYFMSIRLTIGDRPREEHSNLVCDRK